MIKSDKKLKDLTEILKNNNNLVISEAIGLLREDEPFEGAIDLLTICFDNSEDTLIKKSIEGFMNDLKDQSVSKEIMAEIKKPYKPATISMLISSCWQSGLNYSEYSKDMAEMFLKGDYVTAIECLTVLEESVHELSRSKRNEIINIIKDNPVPSADEKSVLTTELISILEREYE